MPITPQTVYVLSYSHKHGTDITIYTTQEAAEAAAAGIAREYWDDMTGSIGTAEMNHNVPESAEDLSDGEATRIYFDVMADRESYEISKAVVQS